MTSNGCCGAASLAVVHAGVFVDHTGPATWLQRAWAAVLYAAPAALSHHSALRAAEGPGSPRPEAPIEVVVARDRRLCPAAALAPLRG